MIEQVHGTLKSYEWGKTGRQSLAYQLSKEGQESSNNSDVERTPYAELWLGTHPSGPATMAVSSTSSSSKPEQTLLQFINLSKNPSKLLGLDQAKQSSGLPFLLKILSIAKPLSIQVHPSKELAEELHKTKPDIYKDDNHKPEMAIALTPFRGFLGFRPAKDIHRQISLTPELARLLGDIPHVDDADFTKIVFTALMTADTSKVAAAAQDLVNRCNLVSDRAEELDLVLQLHKDFPLDIGIFCVFMLNIVHIAPGEAVFLGAGIIHAYISGDIVECMATSDNVIRAGLTPKLRDVSTLLSAISFETTPPATLTLNASQFQKHAIGEISLFNPPVPEFAVIVSRLSKEYANVKHDDLETASIAIIASGSGTMNNRIISRGDAYFISKGAAVDFKIAPDCEKLEIFRAFTRG